MQIEKTKFDGVFVLNTKVHNDKRGYFAEIFKQEFFNKQISKINFIQHNESMSKIGVLRGLHFQKTPYQQSKLVRVVKGLVQDVIVDLRKDSPTFGKYESFFLSDENKKQLFIPKGFAHGYLTLSNDAIFSYLVDNPYSKEHEEGIRYNDPSLAIKWMYEDIYVSERDSQLNFFKKITDE